MTRRRLLTLLGGVLVLGAFSVYRLRQGSGGQPLATPGASQDEPPGARPALSEQDGVVSLLGRTMGTTYTLRFVQREAGAGERVAAVVERVLADVNAAMSTYDPESELSRLNRAGAGEATQVSAELFFVLALSSQLTVQTEGAFDVTVGPLVRAFGFGPGAERAVPSDEELGALRARVGMHHLRLDAALRSVTRDAAGVEIDLSAVAKGYGVDRIASALEAMGLSHYLVEVGGEIRVRGHKPNGEPWLLAVEHPDPDARRIYATLRLPEGAPALATSGDYRNFRQVGGRWISHTFDPRAGRPVPQRTASVSVVRPTAAEADALATGLGVLDPARALELAEQHGWAVMLLLRGRDGQLSRRTSRAFDALGPQYVVGP